MTSGSAIPRPVYLFAGQGAQRVGMGRDLHAEFPAARAAFDRADEVLGVSISGICFEGPEDLLTQTVNCQPALYVCALAALEALKSETGGIPDPAAAAGMSLGQFSALSAAGVFTFDDGLKIVRLRGRWMQEACNASPGGMLAVIGLAPERVDTLAADCDVDVANRNAPGQVVLSGPLDRLETAAAAASQAGAKRVIPLQVAGAYHSRLMQTAADRLRDALARVPMNPPRFPVVCNVTGRPESDPDTLRDLLVRQVVSPVLWEPSMAWCIDRGWGPFLEFGPGGVLSGLLRRIDRQAAGHTIGSSSEVRDIARAFPGSGGDTA